MSRWLIRLGASLPADHSSSRNLINLCGSPADISHHKADHEVDCEDSKKIRESSWQRNEECRATVLRVLVTGRRPGHWQVQRSGIPGTVLQERPEARSLPRQNGQCTH